MLALTTQSDGVIPQAAFEALCSAVGTEGRVLSGRHSWLLAEPDSFDDVLANVIEVRVTQHQARRATTCASQVSEALEGTTFPAKRAAVAAPRRAAAVAHERATSGDRG